MARCNIQAMTVALAGNPNVGKSTLFNVLTGMHQHTGNWPGKTVGVAQGYLRKGNLEYRFVDLPGTYSLDGTTEDEQIAGEYIRQERADCVVAVCDGSCLERNLILVLQLLEQTSKMVVCVNLMDEARSRGIEVDVKALSECLGVPVIPAAAGKKQGIKELLAAVEKVAAEGVKPRKQEETDYVECARRIAEKCVKRGFDTSRSWRNALDRFLTGRRHGLTVMFGLLLLVIWLTVWGANYPSRILQGVFDRGYTLLKQLLAATPWWLQGAVVDGLYATSARVISVMLPPMAIFFPLFTALEDVGYLPRMAFLMDHSMCRCGGCGKQALTMCMGLGCNAVGVMGCRIMDSPRERLAAILTNAMVPCNGRFPTLIVMGSLFFSDAGAAFLVAACVALGMAGAMAASGVLAKTFLKGEQSAFVMEMPPFRRPRLGQILARSLLDRTVYVAGRALRVAAPAGVILWILANTGALRVLAGLLDPLGVLLGMNGVILLAFCLSMPANELLIPVILMVITGAQSLQNVSDVSGQLLMASGITWQIVVCTMVFTVFHWPCTTTLLTIYKETGSMKKTAAAFALPTAVGAAVCYLLQIVFQYFRA